MASHIDANIPQNDMMEFYHWRRTDEWRQNSRVKRMYFSRAKNQTDDNAADDNTKNTHDL